MHCPFSLSPLDDDFMRRGREGHKNNELGREEEKGEQDKAKKAEQTTEYNIYRNRAGLIPICGGS